MRRFKLTLCYTLFFIISFKQYGHFDFPLGGIVAVRGCYVVCHKTVNYHVLHLNKTE